MKRTVTIVAVEPKGRTMVNKEPFPTAALPESEGYELKAPNAEGRWKVSTYRWDPNQIIVNQGAGSRSRSLASMVRSTRP